MDDIFFTGTRGVDGAKERLGTLLRRFGAGFSRALAAASLIATPLALATGGSVAHAADVWEVQVGGDDEVNLVGTQAYLPGSLTIHAGDTVNWTFAGFHTVTFDSGQEPRPLFAPGPNYGELAFGPGFAPAGPTGPNATYDGTVRASSGAPMGDPGDGGPPTYRLTFTKPGMYAYVCDIHPGMRGEIEVREAGAPLPETPAQATARGQATGEALLAKIKADVRNVRPVQAGTVHTALAGLGDAFGASAFQFVGGDPTVRRGDTVVWTMPDPFEVHTVTFTSGATPPESAEPRPQPAGPPLIVMPANVANPVGGDTYTGDGYVNSGLLINGNSFALRFDAPDGIYDYLCLIHPFMKGKVTVAG